MDNKRRRGYCLDLTWLLPLFLFAQGAPFDDAVVSTDMRLVECVYYRHEIFSKVSDRTLLRAYEENWYGGVRGQETGAFAEV